MVQPLRLALEPSRAEVTRLLEALAVFWEEEAVPDADRCRLDLALDEMVTNVIDYSGFSPDGKGSTGLEVSISVQPHGDGVRRQVVAEIRDNGVPHDPNARGTPDLTLDVEERPIGGLGVHLTRSMVDSMEYHREEGWNFVRLVRTLAEDDSSLSDDAGASDPTQQNQIQS